MGFFYLKRNEMKKFEYMIIDKQEDTIEHELNKHGKQGWELIQVIGNYVGHRTQIFKREVQ